MKKALFAVFFSLMPITAHAHLLKVFAHAKPVANTDQILVTGKVYFAGGAGLNKLTFKVVDENKNLVLSPRTDVNGKFSFKVVADDYQIIANSHDGHIAKWQVRAKANDSSSTQAVSGRTLNVDQPLKNAAQIDKIVANQLQTQLAPLKEQIHALQEKRYLQDIIGGLGYIFGLYGLAIFFTQRKKKSP